MKTKASYQSMVPRLVAFLDNKAIAVGLSCNHYPKAKLEVIHLPTDNLDFIGPVNVLGKTRKEIELEAECVRLGMSETP